MAADTNIAPGWFGKIPYLGDFASRRLPQNFIGAWDSWLQQSVASSRNQLGARWLEIYLHSPIWRFVLMPGVIGNNFWAGLTMPSVDKVGRHFPLTVAVEMAPWSGVFVAVMAAREWFHALEDAALATLNTEYPVEQFEAALTALPFPTGMLSDANTQAAQCAQWWRQPNGPFGTILPEGVSAHHLVCAAATQLFEAAGAGKSVWWHELHTAPVTRLTCFAGLPSPEVYAALLTTQPAPVAGEPAAQQGLASGAP